MVDFYMLTWKEPKDKVLNEVKKEMHKVGSSQIQSILLYGNADPLFPDLLLFQEKLEISILCEISKFLRLKNNLNSFKDAYGNKTHLRGGWGP